MGEFCVVESQIIRLESWSVPTIQICTSLVLVAGSLHLRSEPIVKTQAHLISLVGLATVGVVLIACSGSTNNDNKIYFDERNSSNSSRDALFAEVETPTSSLSRTFVSNTDKTSKDNGNEGHADFAEPPSRLSGAFPNSVLGDIG